MKILYNIQWHKTTIFNMGTEDGNDPEEGV